MSKLLFIGGTHGNEGFGVEALRETEATYERTTYNYDWIVGNPRALKANVRFTKTDLNRSAPGNPASRNYEERRAAEIVEISREYDAVIDVHGTVADCGLVIIIPNPTAENLALAKTIPIARNVVWYSEESKVSGPLAQHTSCPAIEIECGPQKDPAIKEQLKVVLSMLLIANVDNDFKPDVKQEYYQVYGSEYGVWNADYQDFQPVTLGSETFYPFLSSQYEGISCYKMRQVSPKEIVL